MATRTVTYAGSALLKTADNSNFIYVGSEDKYYNAGESKLYTQDVSAEAISASSMALTGNMTLVDLSASGDISGVDIDASGNMSCVQLDASGAVNGDSADITNNASVGGALTVTGNGTFADVNGSNATFSGAVAGDNGTFTGDVNVTGDITGGNDCTLSGQLQAPEIQVTDDAEIVGTLTHAESGAQMTSLQTTAPNFEDGRSVREYSISAFSNDGSNVLKSYDLSDGITKDALIGFDALIVAKKDDASLEYGGCFRVNGVASYVASTGNASVLSSAIEQIGLTSSADTDGYNVSVASSTSNLQFSCTTGADTAGDAKVMWSIDVARSMLACSQ